MVIKINILYQFKEGPWGGGNQFLKALRQYFINRNLYTEHVSEADVILFNSFPFGNEHLFETILEIKRVHPEKILIHRVDGPIQYTRGRDKIVDDLIFSFNNLVADGTVFQSKWCKDKNYLAGYKPLKYEAIITNAPDSSIFNGTGKKRFDINKIKLIATSWSSNTKKGFEVYKYLDDHLDFKKYEMTFVGNSPVKFSNIRYVNPVPSAELSIFLKDNDIFITASSNDPCSNSLIEALHCRLPAVYLNNGGHPEIVGQGGEPFNSKSDIIDSIEQVALNYYSYQGNINVPSLDDVGNQYYQFAMRLYNDYKNNLYNPKHTKKVLQMKFKLSLAYRNVKEKVERV